MLYTNTELKNAFFFEIETAPRKDWSALSPEEMNYWRNRYHNHFAQRIAGTDGDTYHTFAKYIPEFSVIRDISIGLIEELKKNELTLSSDTISGTEVEVLSGIAQAMDKMASMTIAGWNIANYQIPYLVKRMLANKVKLPFLINLRGKKPWDINMIDVMRDYQGNMFGDIELGLVASQFDIQADCGNGASRLANVMNIARAMSK